MTTSRLVPAGPVGLAEPLASLVRSRPGAAVARTPRSAALALGLTLVAACAGDHAAGTGPSPITPTEAVTRGTCGGSSPLQLGVLQGITLDCATATSVQLAG